ncbi:MAG: PhzF family phenazine biosynthesis protein [Nitriliruptor sp.]
MLLIRPDLSAVTALGSTGLIVTAPGDGDTDLVSRYFAPAVGIDEDPVTGSAHCTLGPLWAERLGRDELTARQVSPRGGALRLRVDGDRVHVGGRAVTVIEGTVAAPDR